MAKLYNLARVQTATTGTGTVSLGSAVSGYLTFALAGVANTELVSYGIKDGANSEVGFGVYTSSGTTLSRFVRKSTNSDALLNLSGAAEVFITSLAADIVLPKGYIYGLTLSNNVTDATNDIDIATGEAVDSTGVVNMVLASALTKRLDAAWAVGSGNGGLDTGSIANTTYHIHLIMRQDTGVVDALFSTSATAPTMPTNYTHSRLIGSIVRLSAAIKAFSQQGDEFLWLDNVTDANGVTTSATAADVTLTVPTGVQLYALLTLRVDYISLATTVLVTSKLQNDQAASTQNQTTVVSSGSTPNGANLNLRTNTSAQVRIRASGTGAQYIILTTGFIHPRGRT